MSDNESIVRWTSVMYRYAQIYLNRELKPYNIGAGQHSILMVLYENNGIAQEDITNTLHLDKGTTAKTIKKLVEEGYIIRKKNIDDRRAYKIFLTKKARNIRGDLIRILSRWTDIISTGFTENEREITFGLFGRMAHNAWSFLMRSN